MPVTEMKDDVYKIPEFAGSFERSIGDAIEMLARRRRIAPC